jgi:hypothetical protein
MALGPSSFASVRRPHVARLEDVEGAYEGPRAHHRSLTPSAAAGLGDGPRPLVGTW